MATLTLLYPSAGAIPVATGPARKVTLTSAAGTTTFTVTDPEVELTNLGNKWVEVPRPGARPFLHNSGPANRRAHIKATLYTNPPNNVTPDLAALIFDHANAEEVTCAYSWLETFKAVIDGLRVTIRQRVEGSNEPYWADVEFDLVDRPPDLKQLVPVPAPSAAPPPPAAPAAAAPAGGQWYTVRAGDTLYKIAQRFYGHGDRFPVIATANGIRNPNLIRVGQRLRIP